MKIRHVLAAVAAIGILDALVVAMPAHLAQARPVYAQQTGLPCAQCHFNPAGGGPRNAFGRAFARNGHRLPGTLYSRSGRTVPRYDGRQWRGYGPGMMSDFGHGPGTMRW